MATILNKGQAPQLLESAARAALRLVETEFSHDEQERLLYGALDAENGGSRYTSAGHYVYRYIRRVYDAFFIYAQEVDDYRQQFYREYSIDEAGAVTLSAPIEVRSELKFLDVATGQPVTGALQEKARAVATGERKELHETRTGGVVSVREAGSSSAVFRIKIIAPGKGSSGTYTREVLERDLAKAFPKGTHMYADHPSQSQRIDQPERKVSELVAVFVEDPIYEANAPTGEGGYVDVKVFGDYVGFITERMADIGTSINGYGTFEVSDAGEIIITSLTEGESVDFVTKAGAGGKIISLKEAAHDAARLNQESNVNTQNSGAQSAQAVATDATAPTVEAQIADLEAQLTKLKGTGATATTEAQAAQPLTAEAIKDMITAAVEAAVNPTGTNPVHGMGDGAAVREGSSRATNGAASILRGVGL